MLLLAKISAIQLIACQDLFDTTNYLPKSPPETKYAIISNLNYQNKRPLAPSGSSHTEHDAMSRPGESDVAAYTSGRRTGGEDGAEEGQVERMHHVLEALPDLRQNGHGGRRGLRLRQPGGCPHTATMCRSPEVEARPPHDAMLEEVVTGLQERHLDLRQNSHGGHCTGAACVLGQPITGEELRLGLGIYWHN
jgi:hypothetical protein